MPNATGRRLSTDPHQMSAAETTGLEELAQLRDRVRALEMRLDRIEQRGPVAVPEVEHETAPISGVEPATIDTEFAAATVLLVVVTVFATLLPARRSARTNPAVVLRGE